MKTDRVFLTGISGAGKSTVGPALAERLGWEFVDSDREIERRDGRAITDIFAAEGEAAFRSREVAVLDELSRRERLVIATGGGAPTTTGGRDAIGRGFSAWLDVSPAVAAARLQSQPGSEERPLLAGNAEARLAGLLAARRHLYERADLRVNVDAGSPEDVAAVIADALSEAGGLAATVVTPSTRYPIFAREGALASAGEVARRAGLQGRAFVITDSNVGPLFAPALEHSLAAADYPVSSFTIAAGEAEKTLAAVERVYSWLNESRAERRDFIVCLGGGVVTDLGGFTAATYLRGIPFIHVPTSLLGMVDAAVGGKTGVDLPAAKNMVGAFAQPSAVICDPAVLERLPERQLRSGWAEVVKHGLILDEHLLSALEAVAGDPAAMRSAELIGRSVAIKAAVVSDDEREADRRTLLNYGHTIGHALEAVTGYERYLHGEAVAVGMHAAGRISRDLGLLAPEGLERQQEILARCGLPAAATDVQLGPVLEATLLDKKVAGGRVRWVLLEAIGLACIRGDVPDSAVHDAAKPLFA